jgi:hypothetical protein
MDDSSMTRQCIDHAFIRGFRAGVRGIVLGHPHAPRPRVRRTVGSLATDRVDRHRDMERFGNDVRQGQADVIRP